MSWILMLPKERLLAEDAEPPLRTPDGRYIIVQGKLWRTSNPSLDEADRQALVNDLMNARRAVGAAKRSGNAREEKAARAKVHTAKVALGERGPVWWDDGTPDENRTLVHNSSYADWWRDAGHASPG